MEEQITAMAEDIWLAVLGLPLMRSESAVPYVAQELLTGSVAISGAWQGMVQIQCSAAFAQRAASVMFGLEPLHVGPEEGRDALGELANMVSGNLKAVLPGPSRLCLPIVADGPLNFGTATPAKKSEVWLECGEDAILVSVATTVPGLAPALANPA
jgi:chemotaxis protein CheX